MELYRRKRKKRKNFSPLHLILISSFTFDYRKRKVNLILIEVLSLKRKKVFCTLWFLFLDGGGWYSIWLFRTKSFWIFEGRFRSIKRWNGGFCCSLIWYHQRRVDNLRFWILLWWILEKGLQWDWSHYVKLDLAGNISQI